MISSMHPRRLAQGPCSLPGQPVLHSPFQAGLSERRVPLSIPALGDPSMNLVMGLNQEAAMHAMG